MTTKASKTVLQEEQTSSIRFIALIVPDLRAAEHYYRGVFEMEVIGREACWKTAYGTPCPLIKAGMMPKLRPLNWACSVFEKGNFVLALFKGDAFTGKYM